MEHKSHTVRVKSLPQTKILCTVSNKPVILLVTIWGVTFMVILLASVKIVAIPFLLYCILMSTKPYEVNFKGSNSFFVVYNPEFKDECDIYYLSEVKKWTYENSLFSPKVIVFLNDGEKVVLNNSGSEKVGYFRKVMPHKEVERVH